MTTLIIPCAGESSRYPGRRPKWLFTHPDGKLIIQKSAENLINLKKIKRTVIVINEQIDKEFSAKYILKRAFGKNIEVCVLKKKTSSASETVAKTISSLKIEGPIFVKDSDCSFKLPNKDILNKNFIAGVDLEKFTELSNIHEKSFVILNNNKQVTDLIEKKIRSNKICVGLYAFSSAKIFLESYNDLFHQYITKKVKKNIIQNKKKELFVSIIVRYLVNQNIIFNYVEAEKYEDYGTFRDFLNIRSNYKNIFTDLDGVLFQNTGRYGKRNWQSKISILKNNVNTLLNLNKKGAKIIFCTARPKSYRNKIKKIIINMGFKNFDLITELNHSQRIIINDYSYSNPNPTALAINVRRDSDNLEELIND